MYCVGQVLEHRHLARVIQITQIGQNGVTAIDLRLTQQLTLDLDDLELYSPVLDVTDDPGEF